MEMLEQKTFFQNFFKGLEFEEQSHRYSLGSKPLSLSVSGIVKKFVNPFDTAGKSLKKALEEGLIQAEILDRWEKKKNTACDFGTSVHLFGENYTFNRELKPSNGHEEAIVKFFSKLPPYIIPAMTELQMYHKDYLFAGTCDTLLFNSKTGNFILSDYKSNKELFKNFGGQKLLGCFSDLLENNFNKYQIQLSLYQILFEQTGYKIEERRVIHLLPDGEFYAYKAEDYTDRLKNYLEKNKLC